MPVSLMCQYCAQSYPKTPCLVVISRYCSRRCQGLNKLAYRVCPTCKTLFRAGAVRHTKYCHPTCVPKKLPEPLDVRFWRHVDRSGGPDACWPWIGTKCGKYGIIAVWEDGKVVNHKPSHVAYELTYGPLPDGMQACHTCDNPPCCQPKHLFAGTGQDNMDDAKRKGRTLRGERNAAAKLTEDQVRYIRQMRGQCTQQVLADEFHVTQNLISKIQLFQIWNYVNN